MPQQPIPQQPIPQQYWVGEFFVDLSRNQIGLNDQSQSITPKALAVLTYLAQRQGQVVTYDELLDNIWPDSVVTANTLQRCIAQLRKSMGENRKGSTIIKTHSKQGYSVDAEVRWLDTEVETATDAMASANSGLTSELKPELGPEPKNSAIPVKDIPTQPHSLADERLAFGQTKSLTQPVNLLVVLLLALVVFWGWPDPQQTLTFEDLRYLTATDKKEYGASYSPDGNHILFHRYFDHVCVNNIWVKDAKTHRESQLVAHNGTYSGQSLSPNGETLVFVQEQDCTEPVTQQSCFTLMSLDFQKGLSEPQTPKPLLHCQNSQIWNPKWLDDEHIALMQQQDMGWRLMRYSLADNSSEPLYQALDGAIVGFDYSPQQHVIAVTSIRHGQGYYLDILKVTGEWVSSQPIQLPDEVAPYAKISPRFVPDTEALIFSDGFALYLLSFDGQVQPIDYAFEQNAAGPSFHPSGDKLLMIKGRYDSDIAYLPIPTGEVSENSPLNYTVLARSTEADDEAKYHPATGGIAFISQRTGQDQVWLLENGVPRLVSDFPQGRFLFSLDIAEDGQSLLVEASLSLFVLRLGNSPEAAQISPIDLPFPIHQVFHWDAQAQKVWANILVAGQAVFAEVDLSTQSHRVLQEQDVVWASKTPDGRWVYLDQKQRFWLTGAIEDKLLAGLSEQGSSKRFVIDQQHIYGINRDNQLWTYNLNNGALTILGQVPENVLHITDIRDNQLLLKVAVSEKKEVIELSVHR